MKHQGTYIAGVWDLHKCSESVFEKGPIQNRAPHVSADIYLSLVTGPHHSWNTHVEDLAIAVLWANMTLSGYVMYPMEHSAQSFHTIRVDTVLFKLTQWQLAGCTEIKLPVGIS